MVESTTHQIETISHELKNGNSINVEFDIDKTEAIRQYAKQAGNNEKPIIEIVQNARDANATHLHITLDKKTLTAIDNGKGMTLDEIMTRFKIICHAEKRQNDDSIGEFGVGRFQVFNMGKTTWKTNDYKLTVDLSKSHEFKIEKLDEPIKGTEIHVVFFSPLSYSWSVKDNIISYKRAILPRDDMEIYFNEEKHTRTISEITELSDENFLVFNSFEMANNIYSQNLRICYNRDSVFGYNINCIIKMDLNQARNEFINEAETTKLLNKKIVECEKYFLLKNKRFDDKQCKSIMQMILEDKIEIKEIEDKKIFKRTDGRYLTLDDLKSKKILFGSRNIWSDNCIQKGYNVIDYNFRRLVEEIDTHSSLCLEYEEKSVKEISEVGYKNPADEKKLGSDVRYLYLARELNRIVLDKVIKDIRDIEVGDSDVSDAWTDGYEKIWINKHVFSRLGDKTDAILKLWSIMCHEYAHDDDTMEDDYHNLDFYEKYHKITQKTISHLSRAIEIIKFKELKEIWGN